MTCAAEYGPRLRSRGFRLTTQRKAILDVLRHARGHVSPMTVYARARRAAPRLTQPTVYRTLEFLVRVGIVWHTNLDNGHSAYELANVNHHHLICRECGSQVDIGEDLVDRAYRRLEIVTGYVLDHNHVTLTGLCSKCRTRQLAARKR